MLNQFTDYYKVNHNYFSIPTPENCYWGGFIAADGYVNKDRPRLSIRLHPKDKTLLKKLKQCLSFTGPIKKGIYE